MRTQTPHLWWGSTQQIAQALAGARSVQWQADPHVDAALNAIQAVWQAASVPPASTRHRQPCLFEAVAQPCKSFSEWWRHTRLSG